MQESFDGVKAHVLVVVSSGANLLAPKRLRIAHIKDSRSRQPQQSVECKEQKCAQEKGGHKNIHPVQSGIVFSICVIGVNNIIREIHVSPGMASLAGVKTLGLVYM